MRTGAKKYNTNYKKKIDIHRNTLLPRRSPKEIIQYSGCGAFYHRRHWILAAPPRFSNPVHAIRFIAGHCAVTKHAATQIHVGVNLSFPSSANGFGVFSRP